MKTLTIAALAFAAGATAVAPSDLLIADDIPDGFEQAAESPTDLTFEEYAPLSPDAVGHVAPDSSAALAMRAAVDVWASEDDDVLLREVTRWAAEADAAAFVEQAIVVGVEAGLDRRDPPFDGAVAYIGADDGLWTRTVAWQQGEYAMSVAHFGVFEGSNQIIDEAATGLRDRVIAETGHDVVTSAVTSSGGGTVSDSSSGGGIGIGTVVLWIAVIAGVTWLIMRLRRRAAGDEPRPGRSGGGARRDRPDGGDGDRGVDEPTDVDDIIERTRARRRAEREIEAIPDPTEPGWTPPDDD